MRLELRQLVAKDFLRSRAGGERNDIVYLEQALFEQGNILAGSFRVGLAVGVGVQPGLCRFLQRSVSVRDSDEGVGLFNETLADCLLTEIQAKAVFRVILEQ